MVPPLMSKRSQPRERNRLDEDFILECKAFYLTIYDDVSQRIRSKSELQVALQQTGRNPSQKSLEKHWTRDTKRLTFEQFCEICSKERATSEDDLMRAFRRMDVNGDGFISHGELVKMMTQRGEKMSEEEVRRMIAEVDENRDGKLNYQEFCRLIMSTTDEVKRLARRKLERAEVKKPSPRNDKPAKSPRPAKPSNEELVENGRSESKEPENANGTPENDAPTNGTSSPVRESPKPVPRPRSASRTSDDAPRPQPRQRRDERPKSPVASKKIRLPEPRTLREWRTLMKKGVLHLDEDGSLTSHMYKLTLTESTDTWMTIQTRPLHPDAESSKAPLDLCVLVLNQTTEKVVSLSELRDTKGKYCLRCDLSEGNYLILPFSTGCRLRKRSSDSNKQSTLVRSEGDTYVLSKAFREALLEIFEMSDLDGNGLLSREEFNFYNLRTSGEPVQDDEWEVVEENIELKDGQITMKGFVQLNEMEAEDNDGDTGDLWVTLHSMGYNNQLVVDEACPFTLTVYIEEDDAARLDVAGFTPRKQVEQSLAHVIINKGDAVKLSKEVTLHIYSTNYMSCYTVENRSRSKQAVQLDSTKSSNCVTNHSSLEVKVTVPPKSTSAPVFVMPANERQEWTVRCSETLL